MTIDLAELQRLDRDDPLAHFRAAFDLPPDIAYLDGNSLGAMPKATAARVGRVITEEWGVGLIRSWNDAGWLALPARLGDKLARLLGAPAGSILAADATSINLFKLLAAALSLRTDRHVILSEAGNFPTDLYIAEGLATLLGRGHTLRLVEPGEIADALGPEVAVVMLTHVNYRTGAMHDMAALTRAAHQHGALILWDLAHSAGAVPVALAEADADFAVGCGYKFLNGGPGAPAFLYVAPGLQAAARYPITGWLGHAEPFGFHPVYAPADGIVRATVGTPSIIALAALEVGVDIALQAPMVELRAKSQLQAELLITLVEAACPELTLVTPREASARGSQVSFRHPVAERLIQALTARGVVADFRPPDILRFGITPLTLRYADLWHVATALAEALNAERARGVEDRH